MRINKSMLNASSPIYAHTCATAGTLVFTIGGVLEKVYYTYASANFCCYGEDIRATKIAKDIVVGLIIPGK